LNAAIHHILLATCITFVIAHLEVMSIGFTETGL